MKEHIVRGFTMGKEYTRGWREAKKDFAEGEEPLIKPFDALDHDSEFVKGYSDGWTACLFRKDVEREQNQT